ncbi:MAG: hypothetical protein D6731_12385 [Planctomycetota bacterium]|nr:MAG: hypothetical protein D6731_12385 [Planctomycetota bacterium]
MSDEPGFIERSKQELKGRIRDSAEELLSREEERLRAELERIKETWLKKKEDDLNYFREAFYYQYNLIMLCGLVALAAASGPFLPLVASVAVAWELLWLGLAPGNERFRRMIRAEKNAELVAEQEEKRKERLRDLPLPLLERHEEAVAIAEEIRRRAEDCEEGELDVLDETIAKLDYLLDQYADMLVSLHKTSELLKDPEAETLADRVAALEEEVASTPAGKLRQAKQKNLAVLRQRLERYAKSRENKEYFEVSLSTLEDTLKLVRDRVVAASTAGAISDSLDQVVLELSQHRDFMEAAEQARLEMNEEALEAPPARLETNDEALEAPQAAPFAGTAVDPTGELTPEFSAPPEAPAPEEDERPPDLLQEFARE